LPDRRYIAGHPEAVATALLLATVAIWGATPQVTAVGASYARPLTLTSLRAMPTAVILLLAFPLLRFRLPRGRSAWLFTAVGGLLMVALFLGGLTEAVIRAGPGNAIVMTSTSPFWVALLGRVVHGEKIALRTLTGLVVGFVGVVVVFSSQLGAQSGAGRTIVGLAFALAAAFGWAVGTLVVKEQLSRQPDSDLMGIVAGQYLVGGAVLVVLSLSVEGTAGARWGSGNLWLAVAFIAVVGSAIATVAYFGALRVISATRATSWSFLSPVVAILIGVGLGTVPKPLVLVGMAITIAGVNIVNLPARPRRTEAADALVADAGTAVFGPAVSPSSSPAP